MLKNMVALIAGGAGSLGSATAKKLLEEGCKVMVFDLPSVNRESLAKKVGAEVEFCPGDVTSEEDVMAAVNKVRSQFGKLDAVVNCAGISSPRVVYNFKQKTAQDLETFNEMLRVNVGGTFNVMRLCLELMSENTPDEDGLRGVVVNTSGFAAFDGQMGQSSVSASWGAISSMTLPLCRELGGVGIRVMSIAPGVMDSNLMVKLPQKVLEHFSAMTPSPKRLGQPEEYAHLVKTILENKFLNGDTIKLDGGLRLHLL